MLRTEGQYGPQYGKIYQGGQHPATDMQFLKDRNIKLVINCTSGLAQPWWVCAVGDNVPEWQRFEVSNTLYRAATLASSAALAARVGFVLRLPSTSARLLATPLQFG
eukprot:11943621-Alexandrium_andersonii.AAC.1